MQMVCFRVVVFFPSSYQPTPVGLSPAPGRRRESHLPRRRQPVINPSAVCRGGEVGVGVG